MVDAARTGAGTTWTWRRAGLLATLSVVLAAVLLPVEADNPPGFYRDESGIALNAARIAESGQDEYGSTLPLYFRSYGDWKSAPYVYLLAAVFRVTGPDQLVARGVSAVLMVAAVVVLAVTAHRLTRSTGVAVAVGGLAAATPWLFELSRLVFEVALEPLLVALLLMLLAGGRSGYGWSLRRAAGIGVTLALIAYSYAGGRALAPLLGLALLVFVPAAGRRSVLTAWAAAAVALVPLALFVAVNPRALLVRFGNVSEVGDQGILASVRSVSGNLARELDLLQWVTTGDANLRHHVGSTGSLLAAGVLLSLAGVAVLVRDRAWNPYWSYAVLGCVAAAVPAAISDARLHALRSAALPVFLVVLAVPALDALRRNLDRAAGRAAVVLLLVLAVGQAALFRAQYAELGPDRVQAFHGDFPAVLRAALDQTGRPVVTYAGDPDAMGNATWYAELWDEQVHVLDDDRQAPSGAVVVASERRCDHCRTVAERGMFVAYVAR